MIRPAITSNTNKIISNISPNETPSCISFRHYLSSRINTSSLMRTSYPPTSLTAKTSFEAMKKMKGKFNYQLWGNKEYMGGDGVAMEEGKMFNKGTGK